MINQQSRKSRSRRAVRKLLHQHIRDEKLYSNLMRNLMKVNKPFSMLKPKTGDNNFILLHDKI